MKTIYITSKKLDTADYDTNLYREDIEEVGMQEVVEQEIEWLLSTGVASLEPIGRFIYPLTYNNIKDIFKEWL